MLFWAIKEKAQHCIHNSQMDAETKKYKFHLILLLYPLILQFMDIPQYLLSTTDDEQLMETQQDNNMTALCYYKLLKKLYHHANQLIDTVDNEGDEIMKEVDNKSKW